MSRQMRFAMVFAAVVLAGMLGAVHLGSPHPASAANNGAHPREYVITDYGAIGDGHFDNAPIINGLIQQLPSDGGTIVIPHGEFRINWPIVIDRPYVTIRGMNHGVRSNIDAHVHGQQSVGGGSKIIVGAGIREGIAVFGGGPRISGILIKDLCIVGSDPGFYQHGVFIDRPNDGTRIENITCLNLNKGIFIVHADAARISGCWLAECESPLHMLFGTQCIVSNNHLGGQSGGVTADIHGHLHLTFTGNNIFPDGYTGLWLSDCHQANVSSNSIVAWYTGAVIIEGNMNVLNNNVITAALLEGWWLPDPRGRDGLWGLVRIVGNDNQVANNNIMSWQPEGDSRLHVVAGDRNSLSHNRIGGLLSDKRVIINGIHTQWTQILYCGWPEEIDLGGSPTARVVYSP